MARTRQAPRDRGDDPLSTAIAATAADLTSLRRELQQQDEAYHHLEQRLARLVEQARQLRSALRLPAIRSTQHGPELAEWSPLTLENEPGGRCFAARYQDPNAIV